MENPEGTYNYNRIAKAIQFIIDNQTSQPNLDKIAEHVHISPFHFQRIFQEWVGTTPKKFLEYISLTHAKHILAKNSIQETTQTLGLSSTSRLHELFVKIEAMTPTEYKNEGESLLIHYSIHESPFGQVAVASTSKGICQISFLEESSNPLEVLKPRFPKATYILQEESIHQDALAIFNTSSTNRKPISVHLKGSSFQLKVWEALLKIPAGNLQTYGDIAKAINQPTASRAVGTAIGSNPLAYLIPCHRVIQASGVFGGYMWNPIRKTAIIGWEGASTNFINHEAI